MAGGQALAYKERVSRAVDARASSWESRFREAAKQAFEKDRRNLLAINNAGRKKALAAKAMISWESTSDEMRRYMMEQSPEHWQEIFLPVIEGLVTSQGKGLATAFGFQFDVRNLEAADWFSTYAAQFSGEVTGTTKDAIATMLQRANVDGWSHHDMTKALNSSFRAWEGEATDSDRVWLRERLPGTPHNYRAELIARDQTMRASNAGGAALYESWGVERKEWLATIDGRQRTSHETMQRLYGPGTGGVAMNAPFVSPDGWRAMYPGDSSLNAPLGEIIQCRCTSLPVVDAERPRVETPEPTREAFGSLEEARGWAGERGMSLVDDIPDDMARRFGEDMSARKWTPKDAEKMASAYEQMEGTLSPKLMRALRGSRAMSMGSQSGGTLGRSLASDAGDVIAVDARRRVSKQVASDFVDLSAQGRWRHELAHTIGSRRAYIDLDWSDIGFTTDSYMPSTYANASISEHWAELITQVTAPGFDIDSLPISTQRVVRQLIK